MTGARPSKTLAAIRRRQQILEATRELLRERDADKVLVADVAARAGLSVATIYNLIGTRDRLLVAVLDDTVERIDQLVAVIDAASGVDQCLQIISVACDVVLADPHPQRAVVGAMGSMGSDVWLIDGLSSRLIGGVDRAVSEAAFAEPVKPSLLADSLLLGFRGVLISWVFRQLGDDDLKRSAELLALQVLANAATPALRTELLERIDAIAATSQDRTCS